MAQAIKDLTAKGNNNWTIDRLPTLEDLSLSAIMRIADATEVMASNYVKLQNDLDSYKRWYEQRGEMITSRDRTISALRGQITKLKKRLPTS